jgi:hypothetical protein
MKGVSRQAPTGKVNGVVETTPTLSAVNLKQALWETLYAIKDNKMLPGQGDAVAAQAREILRTVKVQLQIAAQGKHQVPMDVIDFAQK